MQKKTQDELIAQLKMAAAVKFPRLLKEYESTIRKELSKIDEDDKDLQQGTLREIAQALIAATLGRVD